MQERILANQLRIQKFNAELEERRRRENQQLSKKRREAEMWKASSTFFCLFRLIPHSEHAATASSRDQLPVDARKKHQN